MFLETNCQFFKSVIPVSVDGKKNHNIIMMLLIKIYLFEDFYQQTNVIQIFLCSLYVPLCILTSTWIIIYLSHLCCNWNIISDNAFFLQLYHLPLGWLCLIQSRTIFVHLYYHNVVYIHRHWRFLVIISIYYYLLVM